MLMVTEDAAKVIRELSGESQVGNLCISAAPASQDGATGLQIQLADAPEPDDAVLEADEGQIYLAAEALPSLEDKVLDAQMEDDGIRFTIMEVAEGEAPPEE